MKRPPTELGVFPIRNLDQYGLVKNLAPNIIPPNAFQDMLNVQLYYGRIRPDYGWQPLPGSPLPTWINHLDQFFENTGSAFLIACTNLQAYAYNSGTGLFTSIQGATNFNASPDNLLDSDTVLGTWLVTDIEDVVQVWAGTGTLAPLAGLTNAYPGSVSVQATLVRAFQNFCVLFNTIENGTVFPQRIRWGQFGSTTNWNNNVDGTGQAGYFDLNQDPTFILAALKFGNYMAVYKSGSIWLLQYVGPPTIFYAQCVVPNRGILSQRGVVQYQPNMHAFVGQDNFYAFDGINAQRIGDPIKNYFFQDLAPMYRNRVECFLNQQDDEVWWIYSSVSSPVAGQPNKKVVWNYVKNTWAKGESSGTRHVLYQAISEGLEWINLPWTWNAWPGPWVNSQYQANAPVMLMGDPAGNVFEIGLGLYNRNGAAYQRFVQSGYLDLGQPLVKKRLQQIWMQMASGYTAGTLQIMIAHVENIGDPLNFQSYPLLAEVGDHLRVNIDIEDNYFVIQLEMDDLNSYFEIYSMFAQYDLGTQY
jgi:hypothetical protein